MPRRRRAAPDTNTAATACEPSQNDETARKPPQDNNVVALPVAPRHRPLQSMGYGAYRVPHPGTLEGQQLVAIRMMQNWMDMLRCLDARVATHGRRLPDLQWRTFIRDLSITLFQAPPPDPLGAARTSDWEASDWDQLIARARPSPGAA